MGTAKKQQTQLGCANTAYGFVLASLPTPIPDKPSGAAGGGGAGGGKRVGVGESAQNKQVLQRVVYIAGGPDVIQEAPRQGPAVFWPAVPPQPWKTLVGRGRRRPVKKFKSL